MNKETVRKNVTITKEQEEWLKDFCRITGLSQSAVIKWSLENFIRIKSVDIIAEGSEK